MKYAEVIAKALAQVTDQSESFWQRLFVDGITSGKLDAAFWLTELPAAEVEASIAYAVEHKSKMLEPIEAGLRKAYEDEVAGQA